VYVVGVTACLRGVPRDLSDADEFYGGDDDWMSKGNTTILAPGGESVAGPLVGEVGSVSATVDRGSPPAVACSIPSATTHGPTCSRWIGAPPAAERVLLERCSRDRRDTSRSQFTSAPEPTEQIERNRTKLLRSNWCSSTVIGMSGGPATATEVLELLVRARDVCVRLEPEAVSLAEVPAVFDALTELDRVAGGAVLRMAARYEEAGVWKRNNARSPEEDLARKTGTGTSRARRRLSTSKRLREQPKTDSAVRKGAVSPEQADEVSEGALAAPEVEDELLDAARRVPLHDLRRRVAEERAKADRDREARAARLHRARQLRRWDDADGMANLLLRLPGDQMASVDARLKPLVDRAFADARDAGRFEPVEAYAADVVRDLLLSDPAGDASSSSGVSRRQAVRPEKKVVAFIDAEALNRGSVEGEETCEIAGVGPVAVSAVRRLLSDAFLTLVFRKGTDVLNVTHLGRQVTAAQRTALEARGCRCERCGSRHLLDIDHNEGWTLTHDTRVEDLSWLCWHCHELKTRHHLRLVGPVGAKRLVRRDGTDWDPPPEEGPPGSDPPVRARGRPEQGDLFTTAR